MFSEHPRVMYHHQVKSNYPLELLGRSKTKTPIQQSSKSQIQSSHSQKKHCSPKLNTGSRIFQLDTNSRVNSQCSEKESKQLQTSRDLIQSSRKHFQKRIVENPKNIIDFLLAGREDIKQSQRGLSNGNIKNGETQAPDIKRLTKPHPRKSINDFYSEIPNILLNEKLKYRTDSERVDNGKRSILKHQKDLKNQYDIFTTQRTQSNFDIMKFQQKKTELKRQTFTSSSLFGSVLGEYSGYVEKKQGKRMFSSQNDALANYQTNPKSENDKILKTSSSSFKNLFQSSIKLG